MKCDKCNAEWQVDASRLASITVCPFCQEEIRSAPQPQRIKTISPQSATPGIDALMTRAWQFVEDGDRKEGADYFNKVLDLDPSYAPAFLGLICVDIKVKKESKLANIKDPDSITNHKYYKRAIVDPSVKSRLDGYIKTINDRIDVKRKAAFRDKYDNFLERFSAQGKVQAEQRRQTAQAQLDAENKKAQAEVEAKCAQIKQKFDDDHKAWQEENIRLKAAYDTEYKKWEITRNKSEVQAERWKSQGLCPHCGGTLKGLFSKKCADCGKLPSDLINVLPQPSQPSYPSEPMMPHIPTYTPRKLDTKTDILSDIIPIIEGEFVFIELDGYKWRVLAEENDKVLLITEEIIEKRPYNDIEEKDITWEQCTLRKYLNGEFYNKLGAIKSAIADTHNDNPNNPWYGTKGGNVTTDKVFLLSLDEVCRYFGDSTANLQKKGGKGSHSYMSDKNDPARNAEYENEMALWWLRSPGDHSSDAAFVFRGGSIFVGGSSVRGGRFVIGVRPALWLNL